MQDLKKKHTSFPLMLSFPFMSCLEIHIFIYSTPAEIHGGPTSGVFLFVCLFVLPQEGDESFYVCAVPQLWQEKATDTAQRPASKGQIVKEFTVTSVRMNFPFVLQILSLCPFVS